MFARALMFAAALLLAVPAALGVKTARHQRTVAIGADGSVRAEGPTDKLIHEAADKDEPFKVMSWNILAEGLADDGFSVSLQGQVPMVTPNSAWDQALKTDNLFEALTRPISEEETAVVGDKVRGSMAEYISDTNKLARYIIPEITQQFDEECKFINKVSDTETLQKDCCTSKALLKYMGTFLQGVMAKKFVQTDEELADVAGLAKATLSGKKCTKVRGGADGKTLRAIEPADLEGKMAHLEATMIRVRQPYINAVHRLDLKWDMGLFTTALEQTVAWGSTVTQEESGSVENAGRGSRLVAKILSESPAILALQELDHYRYFQDALGAAGYQTTLAESGVQHTREEDCSVKGAKLEEGQIERCEADRRFARITKFGSNAQKFNRLKDADNDGIAIFWKKDRFEALDIAKKYFSTIFGTGPGSDDGGVVGVLLKDKNFVTTNRCVFVMSTHLASGDSSDAELERLESLGPQMADWVAATTRELGTKHECTGSPGVQLLMDGNTYQNFAITSGEGRGVPIAVEDDLYHKCLVQGMHLQNFALGPEQVEMEKVSSEAVVDNRPDLPRYIAYSVNKIRGVHSVQVQKVGEYQLDRIDYFATSGHFVQPVIDSLPLVDRTADREGPESPYNSILPSYENPSDHLPLVANVRWAPIDSWPAASQASSHQEEPVVIVGGETVRAEEQDDELAKHDVEEAGDKIEPFKVMSWNILAEGLAGDGFAVSLQGRTPMAAPNSAFNQALLADCPYKALTRPLTEEELSQGAVAKVPSTMAEYISDTNQLAKHVITVLEKKFNTDCKAVNKVSETVTLAKACCTSKALLKQMGEFLQVAMAKNFVLTEEEQVALGDLAKETLGGKKCAKVQLSDGGERSIEPSDLTGKMEQLQAVMLETRQLYINAVHRLGLKWDMGPFTSALAETIEWGSTVTQEEAGHSNENSGRGIRLVQKILAESPAILALQENDHYRFFQDSLEAANYQTTLAESGEKHTREGDCSVKKAKLAESQLAQCSADRRFARITKFASNAQKFNANQDADNDGVTLFWKKDRFQALDIEKKYFSEILGLAPGGNDGGVVGVLLKDKNYKTKNRCVFAMTTHLASGDKSENEEERLETMGPKMAAWVAETTRTLGTKHECADGPGIVLLMDGNAYQNFAVGANEAGRGGALVTVEGNMYHECLVKGMHLQNFAVSPEQSAKEAEMTETPVDGRPDLPRFMAYSVNKVRGVHSVQVQKVGEYQLDRIDYVATSAHFEQPIISSLPLVDRSAPREGPESPYNSILPSHENPSDHLPLVANVHWANLDV